MAEFNKDMKEATKNEIVKNENNKKDNFSKSETVKSEAVVADKKEVKPVVTQQPFVAPKKRTGILKTRIGDKVLVVDKSGKGHMLSNKNYKGVKNGATVEF